MIPVLLFPQFDPVLIQVGPLAIRWYALAYITSLVIGWRLVRRFARLAPAVATPLQVDDFLTWATLGVVLGGRLGYVLFYQPGVYLAHPLTDPGGMGRRHELPWRHAGRRHRHHHLLPPQRHPVVGVRRPDRHRGTAWPRPGAGGELYQRRAVGTSGAELAALGNGVSARAGLPRAFRDVCVARHPSQLYEALMEGPFC